MAAAMGQLYQEMVMRMRIKTARDTEMMGHVLSRRG